MIFIGPALPGGIAQWAYNYTLSFPNSKYYTIGEEIPKCDQAFVFVLPVDTFFKCHEYIKSRVKNITIVTICESQTVHENFNVLMKEYKRIIVPSDFCCNVFSKQFPDNEFIVIPPYIPLTTRPYTFYTIGNMTDERKNFQVLLDSFIKLNNPNTFLVIKQQSTTPIDVNIPNVQIINEQLNDKQMELLHSQCDCYINISHSEGIGMGPIEAAVRNKPVIIPEFGAVSEFVKTPYTIPCKLVPIDKDYMLFTKDMTWGDPDTEKLLEFMKDVVSKKLTYMDHNYTKKIVSSENVVKSFNSFMANDHSRTTTQ